jgi:murein DD-endopeptidase MepM/ murein hydrolase activator NlpD
MPQGTALSALPEAFTGPVADAFSTMRNDSTWTQGGARSMPVPGNVTSGGFPSENMGSAKYHEYKSKGFSNSLASFLGKYNMESLAQRQAAQAAEWAAQNQGQSGGGNYGGQLVGNPGGEYANVDRWNNDIMAAINRVKQEFGMDVPANVVKAVMMLESQGNMVGCNFAGYCGLMQTGAGSNVSNFNAAYNNTVEGNLYYGVQELGNWYRAVGTGNWIDAAAAYFSGYNYDNPGVSDGYGTTVAQYRQIITKHLNAFNNAAGGGGAQGGGSGGGPGVMSLFGSGASIGYDFGVSSSNGLYGYGTSYGLDGTQHTGLDVMQPLGSPLYSPGDATVVCVGCWRNDHITGGVGRIELEMPDGAHILYDHSYSSNVQVGQRVSRGQILGTSGGMYSPHTHLEVRVPDSSQSSGWRLVDPAAYFAGYVGGGGYTQSGGFGQQQARPMTSMQRAQQVLYGRYW